MLSIFDDLLNLAKRIKDAVAHSDENLQEAKDYTDEKLEIIEITPTYINTTAVGTIKCYQLNKITFVFVWLNTGVADQTTLAYGLPTPIGGGYSTVSAFAMNFADISRDFMGYIQNGRLEVRTASTSTGGSGILLSGCYIAE